MFPFDATDRMLVGGYLLNVPARICVMGPSQQEDRNIDGVADTEYTLRVNCFSSTNGDSSATYTCLVGLYSTKQRTKVREKDRGWRNQLSGFTP